MTKIPFEDGVKVSNAKVTIDDVDYNVTPAQYSGATPFSAYNLNQMQDNIETAIDEVDTKYEPEIMYAKLNTEMSVAASYIDITSWVQENKSGNNLTIENGKIKIGAGINKVLVILKLRAYAQGIGALYSFIKCNDRNVDTSWTVVSYPNAAYVTVTSMAVIDVEENDTITANVYSENTTSKVQRNSTTILVQKIA